jgi:hypothetical protein
LLCFGIDTTTAISRFTFNIPATLADFEREIIRERTKAGLDAIEDLELLMITHLDVETMTLTISGMDRYFRMLFQNSLVTTTERKLISSSSYPAEEKYVQLFELNPEIIQSAPQISYSILSRSCTCNFKCENSCLA